MHRKSFKTEEDDEIEMDPKKTSKYENLIMKLADLHDGLIDVVEEINNCFSFQVINSILSKRLFST